MRKVTILSVQAFFNKKACSFSNTSISIDEHGSVFMELYNNKIAMLNTDGQLFISSAGWHTRTTLERLNGILTYHKKNNGCIKNNAYIKNNNIYYNDTYLKNEWLEI